MRDIFRKTFKNPNSWAKEDIKKIQSNATYNFTKCFYCQEGKRPMKEEMRILVSETGNEDALMANSSSSKKTKSEYNSYINEHKVICHQLLILHLSITGNLSPKAKIVKLGHSANPQN